jgi:hypothetical protein
VVNSKFWYYALKGSPRPFAKKNSRRASNRKLLTNPVLAVYIEFSHEGHSSQEGETIVAFFIELDEDGEKEKIDRCD